MAQKTVVTLTDDLDGELADETVKFGLDGVYYEIDLRESNATKLRQLLKPYQSAARRAAPGAAPRGKGGRGRATGGGDRERSAEIRAWAKKHGLPVSERGRISSLLAAAFEANDPSRVKSADSGSQA